MYNNGNYRDFNQEITNIKWQDKLSETNNIDTNWTIVLTTLKDLEHRFIPTKTINMNGRRRNTFSIDKKTRDLIKRKNTCPVLIRQICIHGYLYYPLWYSSSPSRCPGS
jgi:negative regulator of replication initiation